MAAAMVVMEGVGVTEEEEEIEAAFTHIILSLAYPCMLSIVLNMILEQCYGVVWSRTHYNNRLKTPYLRSDNLV